MPIFERPPLETLAMARDRWTPIYLEHGRLEVDDSSVKWIGADGLLCRLPVATISAILLGPGTLPFIYEVADLYKHLTSIPAAFLAVRQNPADDGDLPPKFVGDDKASPSRLFPRAWLWSEVMAGGRP